MGCIWACLDPKAILVYSHLSLVDHHTAFGFAPLKFLISAPRIRDLADAYMTISMMKYEMLNRIKHAKQ
jgi:hypothetical protein